MNTEPKKQTVYLVKLKRDMGAYKSGQSIKATGAMLKAGGLKRGDYDLMGTYPGQVKTDDLPQDKAQPTSTPGADKATPAKAKG